MERILHHRRMFVTSIREKMIKWYSYNFSTNNKTHAVLTTKSSKKLKCHLKICLGNIRLSQIDSKNYCDVVFYCFDNRNLAHCLPLVSRMVFELHLQSMFH